MCHSDRAGGRAEAGDRRSRLEPAHELFQNEYSPGDGRVEGRSETCARACRQQYSAVRPVAAEGPSQHLGDGGAHLHARALAPQREAAADCKDAADELHGCASQRHCRFVTAQRLLDLGDPAAGRVWRESAHQPCCKRRSCSQRDYDEQNARHALAMGPGDESAAQPICLREREPKERAHEPGCRTDHERQGSEDDQAAAILRFDLEFIVCHTLKSVVQYAHMPIA